MSFATFQRDVIPTADRMEYLVPHGAGPFGGLVTAVVPDSPPILQWDTPDKRNPVSWYVYTRGSLASRWGLSAGLWHEVTAITLLPCYWNGRADAHHGKAMILLLDGALDSGRDGGSALFPSMLRSDLHEVRSTLEAYSQSKPMEQREEGSANGVILSHNPEKGWDCKVRVTAGNVVSLYTVDRWE